jgi:ABC-2 type transport system ATP-binding protein
MTAQTIRVDQSSTATTALANMPAIEIESLTKIYSRGGGHSIRAVDDVTLSVAPGQVFGLLGPNSAGTTTTIKLLCGLVTPTAGSVRL